jgi:hypothetical protein
MLTPLHKISRAHGRTITLHEDEDTFAAPSSAPASDRLAAEHANGNAPEQYGLTIVKGESAGGGAVTLDDASLVIYDPIAETWLDAGVLNDGLQISVTDAVGWERPVYDIGFASDVQVVGTASDELTITLTPMERKG